MKNKYIHIPADLTLPCTFIDIDDVPGDDRGEDPDVNRFNERIYQLINCDFYEAVYIHSDLIMLVDETGKLTGKPLNVRASMFYPGTAYGDPIVGDVVFCSLKWVTTVMPDGERIRERDFGPLGPVYSAILADKLGITVPEPA